MDQKLERNIKLVKYIRTCLYAWVTIPTLALFYLDRGLGLSDLILFKVVLSVVALVLEIPSGYFADVFGRRITGICGCCFWAVSITCYIFGSSASDYLIAEILLGVAVSLLSGVDSALVFDSLKALKEEHRYKKIESKLASINGFAEAFGGLIGAYLASFNLIYPFFLQLTLVCTALVLSLFLTEPPRDKTASKASPWKGIMEAVSFALFKHRGIQSLVLFYGVSACGTLLLVWMAQGYMKVVELPTAYFGIAWAVFHLMLAFGSLIAHKIDDYFGAMGTLRLLALIAVTSFLMLGVWQSFYGLVFVVFLYIMRGVRTPVFRYYINHHVSSDIRATILSVLGFSVRFFAIIGGPILSLLIENYSLAFGFVFLAVVTAILLGLSLYLIGRSRIFIED